MIYTMTIDTEEEWDWNGGWPTGRPAVTNISSLPKFQDLCSKFDISTTYFVNSAVLDDKDARAIMMELGQRGGVEIGMHIHPWNTPPLAANATVRARDTFLHNLPDDLITAKLQYVYDRFAELGLKPTSFRGGRYSSGGRITEFLQDRGFWADASVLPLTTWPDDGAPDYRQRDLTPVRVPPRHGRGQPLWEIPLTLGFTRRPFAFWRRAYELVETSWLGKCRVVGIAERLGLVRKVWLNFESPLGDRMLSWLRKLPKLRLPCICFTIHSSSLVSGKGVYTRTSQDQERLFAHMAAVFSALRDSPAFSAMTMTELARHLEETHANSRDQSAR